MTTSNLAATIEGRIVWRLAERYVWAMRTTSARSARSELAQSHVAGCVDVVAAAFQTTSQKILDDLEVVYRTHKKDHDVVQVLCTALHHKYHVNGG